MGQMMISMPHHVVTHRFYVAFTDEKFDTFVDALAISLKDISFDTVKKSGNLCVMYSVDSVNAVDEYFSSPGTLIVNTKDGQGVINSTFHLHDVVADSINVAFDYSRCEVVGIQVSFRFSEYRLIS